MSHLRTFRRPKNRAEIVWVLQFIRYNKEWRLAALLPKAKDPPAWRVAACAATKRDYPWCTALPHQIVHFLSSTSLNGDPCFLCFLQSMHHRSRMCTLCHIQTVDRRLLRNASVTSFRPAIHLPLIYALLFLLIHLSLLPLKPQYSKVLWSAGVWLDWSFMETIGSPLSSNGFIFPHFLSIVEQRPYTFPYASKCEVIIPPNPPR